VKGHGSKINEKNGGRIPRGFQKETGEKWGVGPGEASLKRMGRGAQ